MPGGDRYDRHLIALRHHAFERGTSMTRAPVAACATMSACAAGRSKPAARPGPGGPATSRACVSFSVSVEPPAICRIPDKPVYWHAEMTHVVPGQRRRGHTWTEGCTPLKRARPTLQARSGRTMITNPSYRDRRLRLARLGDPSGHQRIPPSTVPPVPATMERLTHELAMHQLGNGHD